MPPTRRPPARTRPTGTARSARSRPAGPGQRPVRSRPVPAPAAPRARFTNRMAVLVVVFAVLAISYASSMRAYLQQRSHLGDLKAQIASSEKQIGALQQEKRRWQDDAYVEQQARDRFGWVMPGETAYQVIGRDGKPLSGDNRLGDAASLHRTTPQAWWSKAYGTLQEADHPHVDDKPAPLGKIVPPPRQEK